jgi:hypothetical protein
MKLLPTSYYLLRLYWVSRDAISIVVASQSEHRHMLYLNQHVYKSEHPCCTVMHTKTNPVNVGFNGTAPCAPWQSPNQVKACMKSIRHALVSHSSYRFGWPYS